MYAVSFISNIRYLINNVDHKYSISQSNSIRSFPIIQIHAYFQFTNKRYFCLIQLYIDRQVEAQSQISRSDWRMQGTNSLDRNIQFFLRRKHKLHKALGQPFPELQPSNEQQQILGLYNALLNQGNNIPQLDCYIKHQFTLPINCSFHKIMEIMWSLLTVRSGTLIAFVLYRICRKYPFSYWKIYEFVRSLIEKESWKEEQTKAIADLYFYGFPFTIQEFATLIFPRFQIQILDTLPRFMNVCLNNIFFPPKYQKLFANKFEEWMQMQRAKIAQKNSELRQKGTNLQQRIILEQQSERQTMQYVEELEVYETKLYRFSKTYMLLNVDFQIAQFNLKSFFELKKQCSTFKEAFSLSSYEQSLYIGNNSDFMEVKVRKKSEMQKIQSNDYYVSQVKLCNSIQQSNNLGGYFLQQMNLQTNRQRLIEIIINECYNYNNLPYIVKIIAEIGRRETSIKDYCSVKGQKICNQMRMNPKYQRLLCQMVKFSLLHEDVLLDYSDKILKLENSQVTKEVQSILDNLGTMVYYRSLSTHIKINALFQRMEALMKNKVMQFSIQQLFQLKSLHKYLQNHTNESNRGETHEMAHLQIKDNFQFIRKSMEKLKKQNKINSILQYLTEGINNEQYLTSYYYASLLKDIENKQLERQLHLHALSIISTNISSGNHQKSVKWSRFLGELYNYEAISRKMLVDDLQTIVATFTQYKDLGCALKSVCASLETAKIYLKEGEISKDKKKQVILLLIELKKKLITHRDHLQVCTTSEVEDILHYFHPQLVTSLNCLQDISHLINLAQSHKYGSIYYLLDEITKGHTLLDFKSVRSDNKRYREKPQFQQKYVEKIRYIEKETKQENSNDQLTQINSATPYKLNQKIQTDDVQGQIIKKIKVMGRSRKDKTIKTVSCNYVEGPSCE